MAAMQVGNCAQIHPSIESRPGSANQPQQPALLYCCLAAHCLLSRGLSQFRTLIPHRRHHGAKLIPRGGFWTDHFTFCCRTNLGRQP